MYLSELIGDFVEHLEVEGGRSVRTTENYQRYLERFMEFTGDITVDKITTEMLPPKFKQQENSILKCHRAADTITKLLAMYKERKGVQ